MNTFEKLYSFRKFTLFANMASALNEQFDTDVDNNENYFTKEKEDGEIFGKYKRANYNKRI